MSDPSKLELLRQVMGASNVFCAAVEEMLNRSLEDASDGTLGLQQVKLLLLIARPGQRFRVMDIADFLGVTNAAASRAVDRLVQRGLIDRNISSDDRRAVDLALTPLSRGLLDRFAEARNAQLMERLGNVPEDRLRLLFQLLDEVSPRMIDVDQAAGRCARCGVDVRANCVLREMMGHNCSAVAHSAAPGSPAP
jgi:DNA-binding MarR family transcriptional regulator